MPQELEVDMEYDGVVSSVNWTLSQAEEDAIEDFFTGTFALQFSEYLSPSAVARYIYYYPDPPYDNSAPGFPSPAQIRLDWKCDEASSGVSGTLLYAGCTSSVSTVKEFVSLLSPTLAYPVFTDIEGFCSGTAFSDSLTVLTRVNRDAVCLLTSGTAYVNFNVNVTISVP